MVSRRAYLRSAGVVCVGGLSGCLRLSEDGEASDTPAPGTDDSPADDDPEPSTGTEPSAESTEPGEDTVSGASITEWDTTTDGDADARALDTETLELRVFKCSTAVASTNLGEIRGEIEISFDYELTAQQWFEQGMFVVVEDGSETYRSFESGANTLIEHTRGETERGSVSETVAVDGDVDLDFRIEPSPHCRAGDHGETALRVENVDVTVV